MRERMQKIAGSIQRNKYIQAIQNGLMSIIPVTIVGALFTLIDSVNIEFWQNFLESTGLKSLTGIPQAVTIDMISLYAVVAIAYAIAKQFNRDGFPAAVIALVSFLIVTPLHVVGEGFFASTYLPLQWLGAPGLFVAMIMALLIGRLYVLILDKGIYIRMPKGVPPIVEKSFASIVPAMIAIIAALVVRGIFSITSFETVHDFIYTNLQTPLTALGGTWWAYMIAVILMAIFWFFGIHGTMVIISVMMPIWMPLGNEQLVAYQAGEALPHLIPGMPFLMTYGNLGGAAAAFGLLICMLFAKSKRYKTLGRLAIAPGLANINEPVIFGIPLVFNFRLLVPMLLNVIAVNGLAIIATAIGIVPRLNGVAVPLGTPVIFTGIMAGGWRVAVFQVFLCAVSFFIFWFFFKALDKEALALEQSTEAPMDTPA